MCRHDQLCIATVSCAACPVRSTTEALLSAALGPEPQSDHHNLTIPCHDPLTVHLPDNTQRAASAQQSTGPLQFHCRPSQPAAQEEALRAQTHT